jgi:predicted nucleotidyltransferase
MTDMTQAPPTLEALRERRDEIMRLMEQYGAYNVRVFGSVARGDAGPESDVDFLVEFRDGTTLWDTVGLWQDLQELLKREVNLVGEDEYNTDTRFMRRARKDAIPL